MNLNVELIDLDPCKKQLRFELPAEEVDAAFAASAQTLVDYYVAVREQTDRFLDGLDADDPERQVPGFGAGTVALAQRVPGLILEAVQHGGQIAYVRGLVQGPGWQG